MYKSKLQELCHKEKWAPPVYTCLKDGEDHCPNFKASVVVSGVTFNSPTACKSSKQAHNEAARAAFLHFTSELEMDFKTKLEMYAKKKKLQVPVYYSEKDGSCFRARVRIGEDYSFQSEGLTAEKAENAAAQAALLSLSTHAFYQDLATTTVVSDEAEVSRGATAKSKKLADDLNAVFMDGPGLVDDVVELAPRLASLLISDKEGKNPISGSPSNLSSSMKNVDRNADCCANEIESYLVGNRFRIFTSIPKMALPEGTVVLPVDENRWTVMTLEFPAQKPSPSII